MRAGLSSRYLRTLAVRKFLPIFASRRNALVGQRQESRYGFHSRVWVSACVEGEERSSHTLGSVSQATPSQTQPLSKLPTPLLERALCHECLLRDLLDWHSSAVRQCRERGDALADSDGGGPTCEELERELTWLLEDSLAELQTEPGKWRKASWRGVRALREPPSLRVRLRASLEEDLKPMWRSRLEQRVPFQYLVECSHWRDLILAVQPGVLIPRPETEQLADLAAECLSTNPSLAGLPWADLGTGSGALAIALANLLPRTDGAVLAVDCSPVAAAVARHNVQRYGLQARVAVLEGSWFCPLPQGLRGGLGGVVSNPPYIPSQDLPGLQEEVRAHEPWLALSGGPGAGTEAIVEVGRGAADWLAPGGVLIMETNGGEQAHWAAQFLGRMEGGGRFEAVRVERDLFGVDRHVLAVKRG